MVNFPSVSKSGLNGLSDSTSTVPSGQTILYSLLVFVLVGIIVIVSSILYLKSKSLKKRRKYSKPDESLGHENQRSESDGGGGGYNKNVTGIRNSSPFVKLSSFPTSITPVQVNRYSSTTSSSSSSSSSVEESEKSCRYFDTDTVRDGNATIMPTCQAKSSESSGDGGRSPKLTFSLKVVPREDGGQEGIEAKGNGTMIHLNLVEANNLRRSYVDPNTKTVPFSPLTSPNGEEYLFEPEGIFARIFPSQKVKNISPPSRYEKVSLELDKGDVESMKEEISSSSDLEQNVIETAMIRSRRSRNVSFNDQDSIPLEIFQFPVRVTLYEVDRNGVRFSLGHTFIILPHNLDTIHFKTNKLYSTIYRAKNSIKVLK